jgi:hypothetical protein
MKTLKDSCIHFFDNEDTQKDIKAILAPLGDIIYTPLKI